MHCVFLVERLKTAPCCRMEGNSMPMRSAWFSVVLLSLLSACGDARLNDSSEYAAEEAEGQPDDVSGGESSLVTPIVDIRGDHNRNGTVDMTDSTEDTSETIWSATRGAVLLAN